MLWYSVTFADGYEVAVDLEEPVRDNLWRDIVAEVEVDGWLVHIRRWRGWWRGEMRWLIWPTVRHPETGEAKALCDPGALNEPWRRRTPPAPRIMRESCRRHLARFVEQLSFSRRRRLAG
jgi:hypothetical protein